MTSMMNPDYKYHRRLEHRWTTADGGCVCEIAGATLKLVTPYGSADGYYGITDLFDPSRPRGLASVFVIPEAGEEFRLEPGRGLAASPESGELYITRAWFGEGKLHIFFGVRSDVYHIVLTPADAPAAPEDWVCACGYTGKKGNFCPNCGAARPKE